MYYTIHQVRMGFIRAPISDNGKSVSALTRAHICSHHHLHLYLFVQINFYLKRKKTQGFKIGPITFPYSLKDERVGWGCIMLCKSNTKYFT